MVAGLPGIGYVAKQAVDYLIEEVEAALFGEVEAPQLYPPLVMFNEGVVEPLIERKFYRFYLARVEGKNILFFTADGQPPSVEGQHMLADAVVEASVKLGVERILTMAAHPRPRHGEEPKVYAVVTHSHLLEELKLKGIVGMLGRGGISGVNGLLLEYVLRRGLKGICLLSETFVIDGPDVLAAAALVKVVKSLLELKIDTFRIEE